MMCILSFLVLTDYSDLFFVLTSFSLFPISLLKSFLG